MRQGGFLARRAATGFAEHRSAAPVQSIALTHGNSDLKLRADSRADIIGRPATDELTGADR
jgi:hypothetical protein